MVGQLQELLSVLTFEFERAQATPAMRLLDEVSPLKLSPPSSLHSCFGAVASICLGLLQANQMHCRPGLQANCMKGCKLPLLFYGTAEHRFIHTCAFGAKFEVWGWTFLNGDG